MDCCNLESAQLSFHKAVGVVRVIRRRIVSWVIFVGSPNDRRLASRSLIYLWTQMVQLKAWAYLAAHIVLIGSVVGTCLTPSTMRNHSRELYAVLDIHWTFIHAGQELGKR
jgi:hypothetical protein